MTGLSSYLLENSFLTLLLICHFLSDFHLQSQKTADKKDEHLLYFLKHLAGVAVPLFIPFLLNEKSWWILVAIWLSHALIDYLKPRLARLFKCSSATSFLVDQGLHLTIIIFLSRYAAAFSLPSQIQPQFLTGLFFVLLITKPTNIAFKILFQNFQPGSDSSEEKDTIEGAGATIGSLERIVIAVCLVFQQFSSIGLVFTAKSIARYNKISERPAFAEYYLIGSLFSILSVLLVAWICLY